MTPQELFSTEPACPHFIHGSDVGVDEEGGLWVRSDADLWPELGVKVHPLGKRAPARSREYSILTSGKETALNSRYRSEPLWRFVTELKAESVGEDWIAVR